MITYPRETWKTHLAKLNFRQGEHIFVSGPTSSGKTTLIRGPLDRRKYVVALFTKLKDPTIKKEFAGYKRFETWPKHGFNPQTEQKVMIWPSPKRTLRETVIHQRNVMKHAMDRIARDGGWCVMMDETLFMTDPRFLNIGSEVGMLHYFGRSAGISAITLAQRPFNIPRVVLSSATHAYIAQTHDDGDKKRLSDLSRVNPREIESNMANLTDRHDFIYLNPHGDKQPVIVNSRK